MPDKPVDRWHVDSTPFVVVIFLTDPKLHEGGRFEVCGEARTLKLHRTSAPLTSLLLLLSAVLQRHQERGGDHPACLYVSRPTRRRHKKNRCTSSSPTLRLLSPCFPLTAGGVMPRDNVVQPEVPAAGYAVFQQGTAVMHRASAVSKGGSLRRTIQGSLAKTRSRPTFLSSLTTRPLPPPGEERTTFVQSFISPKPGSFGGADHLAQTWNSVDPLHVLLPDWVCPVKHTAPSRGLLLFARSLLLPPRRACGRGWCPTSSARLLRPSPTAVGATSPFAACRPLLQSTRLPTHPRPRSPASCRLCREARRAAGKGLWRSAPAEGADERSVLG